MKAIVIHDAGDLRIEDRDMTGPGPDEVNVAIKAGGICGSDLHYFNNGGFGAIRLIDPMILGHEVAGVIETIGANVTSVSVGDQVAVNPSRPCGNCRFCTEGMHNHCLDMRFYGSAMRRPHIDGAFRQNLIADASQCIVVPADVSMNEAAIAEPLAVVLNAVSKAGNLVGKRVLVTGCGPIGNLAVLVARTAGAREIVATDVVHEALTKVKSLGADVTVNAATQSEKLQDFAKDKGTFDVMFEASGNAAALGAGLNAVRPRGTVIQLGLGGDIEVPQNTIVTKELTLKGTFRFHEEFATAAQMIASRQIDVRPLLTDILPLAKAVEAFKLAGDRTKAMKVQIDFSA